MTIEKKLNQELRNMQIKDTQTWFKKLIQKDQIVGDLYSINYQSAKVQIHDNERKKVGGIPSLSFLIATRVDPDNSDIDFKVEDSSFILLRVIDAAQLPNSSEAERIRVETAQRVSGETDRHWDGEGIMDAKTRVYLGYAGVQCRIIGTFYLDAMTEEKNAQLYLKFGSDISNFYPNRGLKVYKPNAKALELIVNYTDPSNRQEHLEKYRTSESVKLGFIRYASTNRKFQNIDDVPVYIYPADLLSQKSALFGMTRTGKSNTTKIIAKSVYELRYPPKSKDKALRIGQIIFDPNGEYANENVQDADGTNNPNALKNIWNISGEKNKSDEVVTYGITSHPNDPERNLMLINFYLEENLQIGKEIIDNSFKKGESKFIENFQQVEFIAPDVTDRSAMTRYNRRVLAYRALLAKAEFSVPTNLAISTTGLFSNELINGRPNAKNASTQFNGMINVQSDLNNADRFAAAARIFQTANPSLHSLATAFTTLFDYIKTAEYKAFERWYVDDRPSSSGDNWADENFVKILEMIWRGNGPKQIAKVIENHSPARSSDYAEDIYNDLKNGKLVIIDQSSGEPEINQATAERVMWHIFRENQKLFREGQTPTEIIIYIEEAHNLLPSGSDLDLKNVWVRTAKEGAKYCLGMVYATQEVSSIQKNILKNTANWFISHLNNTDETKELCKYYDFADFELSIRRAQDKGFLRIKTLSNPFVIPVQVDKFDVIA
ncbi:MAG: DUF87 domain-containing protein [Candidatus Omnitrophica bacterium]|nr:DUF87 domain-containing protein [Candidatus Omnitrophota bacterium]